MRQRQMKEHGDHPEQQGKAGPGQHKGHRHLGLDLCHIGSGQVFGGEELSPLARDPRSAGAARARDQHGRPDSGEHQGGQGHAAAHQLAQSLDILLLA